MWECSKCRVLKGDPSLQWTQWGSLCSAGLMKSFLVLTSACWVKADFTEMLTVGKTLTFIGLSAMHLNNLLPTC